MLRNTKPRDYAYRMIALLTFVSAVATAQPQTPAEPFSLKDGDRVVFLGNSLLENDLTHGYLELALTTRWPDRNVTFRNIAWSGDNVFGDARSYFTNPPTPYDLLMKQITEAQPTVVFVGYGGIEAQEGEAGLPRFNEGLGKLLDKIEELGAKAVLLSPIPVLSSVNAAQRNSMLQRYATAIANTAAARNARYVDIFNPIQEIKTKVSVTDNDIHLNEIGYYHLAVALEKGLGLPARSEIITIDNTKQSTTTSNARVLTDDRNAGTLKFALDEKYLPIPSPDESAAESGPMLRITGLKKGYYTLAAGGNLVAAASEKEWATGVNIRQGPSFTQASQLRTLIHKKNEIFFHQYRPHNRTYILGFRAYEQGRHAEGLKELGLIVTWLEGQIALTRMPTPHTYELTLLK